MVVWLPMSSSFTKNNTGYATIFQTALYFFWYYGNKYLRNVRHLFRGGNRTRNDLRQISCRLKLGSEGVARCCPTQDTLLWRFL